MFSKETNFCCRSLGSNAKAFSFSLCCTCRSLNLQFIAPKTCSLLLCPLELAPLSLSDLTPQMEVKWLRQDNHTCLRGVGESIVWEPGVRCDNYASSRAQIVNQKFRGLGEMIIDRTSLGASSEIPL